MMNSGKIFLVGTKPGDLTPMTETPYDTEDVLQVLLANHPDLPGQLHVPEIGGTPGVDGGLRFDIDCPKEAESSVSSLVLPRETIHLAGL